MPDKGILGTNFEYALVRSLTGCLALLSRPVAISAGRLLARGFCGGLPHLRRIAERNLRIAFPNLPAEERRRILLGSIDNLGRQLAEFSHFPKTTPATIGRLVEYDPGGRERYEAARRAGKGIIFATAHLGGWEVLAFAHSVLENPLSILVRPLENPKINSFVHRTRARYGNAIIDKRSAALTCARLLRNGGTLGILADLNSLPQEGVFVPFFGKLACTTLAVAGLALATDAIVFPVFAPWDPAKGKYVFRGGPPIEILRTGDHEQDLGINTARLTSVIEKTIRDFPDQWLWIHDRWHALLRPGDRVCRSFPPL